MDSRGNPTVEVDVILETGDVGRAAVPSGASTGAFEAIELRDGDASRYGGKGVLKAVSDVNKIIAPELAGANVFEQAELDRRMIGLDGTENKSRLGANAILGVSGRREGRFRRFGAGALPLSRRGERHHPARSDDEHHQRRPPRGQRHQPSGIHDHAHRREELQLGPRLLRGRLPRAEKAARRPGLFHGRGRRGRLRAQPQERRGGPSAHYRRHRQGGLCSRRGIPHRHGPRFHRAFEAAKEAGHAGKYLFWKTDILKSREEMVDYWEMLLGKYPILSLEDGLAEEDWEGWKLLTHRLGGRLQLVGDDLFVTNTKRLKKGLDLGVANSILIKLNQIGTLTETLDAIALAGGRGYTSVISHRSGETEDSTIADVAVAVNAGQIKTGAPARSDRVAKYNQLLRIEEELGARAVYPGLAALRRQ